MVAACVSTPALVLVLLLLDLERLGSWMKLIWLWAIPYAECQLAVLDFLLYVICCLRSVCKASGFAKVRFTHSFCLLLVGIWADLGIPVTKYNKDVLFWHCLSSLV